MKKYIIGYIVSNIIVFISPILVLFILLIGMSSLVEGAGVFADTDIENFTDSEKEIYDYVNSKFGYSEDGFYIKSVNVDGFIYPLYDEYIITSPYGWRIHPIYGTSRFHKGIDLGTTTGTPIVASADGVVEFSGYAGGYGYVVYINHENGYQTRYAHCSELLVESGDTVKQGEVVTLSGNSGGSTGPHLHFEIRKDGETVDPADYIFFEDGTAKTIDNVSERIDEDETTNNDIEEAVDEATLHN